MPKEHISIEGETLKEKISKVRNVMGYLQKNTASGCKADDPYKSLVRYDLPDDITVLIESVPGGKTVSPLEIAFISCGYSYKQSDSDYAQRAGILISSSSKVMITAISKKEHDTADLIKKLTELAA